MLRVLKRQFISYETQLSGAADEISQLVVYRYPEEETIVAGDARDEPDLIRDVAVLISIAQYQSPEFSNLESGTSLGQLAKSLTDCGFNVQQLIDERRSTIGSTLRSAFASVPPGSRLLVYWSGHSVVANGVQYLVLADSDTDQSDSMIRSDELGRSISEAEYSRVLVILDAAHAGLSVTDLAGALADADPAGARSSQRRPPGIVIGAEQSAERAPTLPGVLLSILDPKNIDTPWTGADELIDGADLVAALDRAFESRDEPGEGRRLVQRSWGDTRYLLKNPGWTAAASRAAPSSDSPTNPPILNSRAKSSHVSRRRQTSPRRRTIYIEYVSPRQSPIN